MSYDVLRSAIVRRHALMATYRNYVRFFCPYSIGTDRNGKAVVVVFQYGGGKPGGLARRGEWQVYEVESLREVSRTYDDWRCGEVNDVPRIDNVDLTAA